MPRRPIARVLPDSRVPQLDREFEYRVPADMKVAPGMTVRVPIGKGGRLASGWVASLHERQEFPGELAEIDSVVSPVSLVTSELWGLARAVAERQAGGVADVLRLAVPKRAVRVENAWLGRSEAVPGAAASHPTPSGYYRAEGISRALGRGSRTSLRVPYGVVEVRGQSVPRGHLEVAFLAAEALARGESSVVCLPDWRDLSLFQIALEDLVEQESRVGFDSDDTPSVKYSRYLRCLEPRPVVAYGMRHVVYTPVTNLGLIAIVDDADSSFQEPLSPYPHTRDVALLRAEQTSAALVLASYTPSLESARFVQMGFFEEIGPDTLTRPRVIPTALTTRTEGATGPARLPSVAHRALAEALKSGPVLVQVFRAGYAPGAVCAGCGQKAQCLHCGGPLSLAEKGNQMRCSWCRALASAWRCRECAGSALRPLGQAVGRTVAELGKAFPGVTVVRADGEHRVERVSGKPSLVVATRGAEPVAEGGYLACLLLDGDAMLQRPSLSALTETLGAWEHAIALLRSDAIAYLTDLTGPVPTAFASGAVDQLIARELHDRSALRLPPTVRLASLEGPQEAVSEIASTLGHRHEGVSVLGSRLVSEGVTRLVMRVPYQAGREVSLTLRAAIVKHATNRRRGTLSMRVAMDDHRALDELAGVAQ